jgi:hypothetical protein
MIAADIPGLGRGGDRFIIFHASGARKHNVATHFTTSPFDTNSTMVSTRTYLTFSLALLRLQDA